MITTDYMRRFIFNIDCLSVLARLSMGLALLMSFSLSAIAQSAAARPERGIAPANSYAVSDIESVSLTNGNLNLSIPLAAWKRISSMTTARGPDCGDASATAATCSVATAC